MGLGVKPVKDRPMYHHYSPIHMLNNQVHEIEWVKAHAEILYDSHHGLCFDLFVVNECMSKASKYYYSGLCLLVAFQDNQT